MASVPIQYDPEMLRRSLAIAPQIPSQTLAGLNNIPAPAGRPVVPDGGAPSAPAMPPDLGISTGQAVKAPRGTVQGDETERTRLMSTGSGISQIPGKIENSQFGQAHPTLGKIAGYGLAGLAGLGDLGLTTLGGGIGRLAEQQIPGTFGHHQVLLNQANRSVAQDESNAEKEAQTGALQAEVPLRQAQAAAFPQEAASKEALTDAQITNLMHPQAKTAFEDWRQKNPDAPTEDFFKAEAAAKPEQKPDTPEQQFIDEFQKTHPGGTVADAVKAYAADTQKPERGPTIIQQTGEADKIAARLGKPYETESTAAGNKLDRIDQTLRSVDAGYVGQGLAIPELLTSVVSGQGTGVRITQPELNMITRHRGIQGDAESWFNSLAGKGNLTVQDKSQIKAILGDVKGRMVERQQILNDVQDQINGAGTRADVVAADKRGRALLMNTERFQEIRRDDNGNYYGSNDGGKTVYDLATGKETK